jgi:hypothetical protein
MSAGVGKIAAITGLSRSGVGELGSIVSYSYMLLPCDEIGVF